MNELIIKSSVFENNKTIPKKYTCQGENINPHLTIEGIPKAAKSLVLIMDDPDAPSGTFDHWIVWNIPPSTIEILENTTIGVEGINSTGENNYYGPCPPPGKPHRYFFKVYALDVLLDLSNASRKADVEKAINGHILANGALIGLFKR
jgi:Raf kinase inhibitor-like YbhB/YbcL family protein